MNPYGIIHFFSLIFLTFVVALVVGMHDTDDIAETKRQALGCWAKLLGSLLGMMLIIYIFHLLAGE